MNGMCRDRVFTATEIGIIESQIKPEYFERKELGILINGRTVEGKRLINQRIADRSNERLSAKIPITAEHIRIYKVCWLDEFTERTGKCTWGFKDVRIKMGYDPDTGLITAKL
jgi:hypothetical protein